MIPVRTAKEIKTAVLFDPSQGSSNLGDLIIRRAIDRELHGLLSKAFVVRYGTHTPLASAGSLVRGRRNQIIANCKNSDVKFICGTNILKENLLHLNSDWSVGPLTAQLYAGSILVGAGLSGSSSITTNAYTRRMYRTILSEEHIHSVRDDRAGEFVTDLGFQAVNTGCPTTWEMVRLSDVQHTLPPRGDSVVVTLTDYAKDHPRDTKLLQILFAEYETVCFWPQGIGDYAYLQRLLPPGRSIELIPPRLENYIEFLEHSNSDFVGTRLHGGILAQELGHRVIILAVDNRARDMARTAPINCIEREHIDELPDLLDDWPTLPANGDIQCVQQWLQQF